MIKLLARLYRLICWPILVLRELEKINANLDRIAKDSGKAASCIRSGINHRPRTPHVVTGSWND